MAKFYIVDQSLINRGGHHYDYTMCIAQAAKKMGFETVIGANQKLSTDTVFPNAHVKRSFTNTVYQRDSFLAGLRHLKRCSDDVLKQPNETHSRLANLKHLYRQQQCQKRRNKIIERFAKDCQQFFGDQSLDESDHVFLTTVSELEMMGLALFLSTSQSSILPTWHLQFHFNLFTGRPPEYGEQANAEKLARECFESVFNNLYCHRLHCYTTSQALAEQYNRLEVCNMSPLPYPVAPEFAEPTQTDRFDGSQPHFINSQRSEKLKLASHASGVQTEVSGDSTSPLGDTSKERSSVQTFARASTKTQTGPSRRTLRFTCPGQIRREKGCHNYLQPLVNTLWESHLSNGKIKIAVQRPARKKFRKQKIEIALPQSGDAASLPHDVIEYFEHPLSREAYIDFIKNTDCGLLFYDSRTYYSRRAGVLGELLSAGKPLIVSAGSWLAKQIAEPNYQYRENLTQTATPSRQLGIEDVEFNEKNAPSTGGVVSFDQEKHPFWLSLNRKPHEHLLLFSFNWRYPTQPGTFVEIRIEQKDGHGNSIATEDQIVGHRENDKQPNCLFRFHRDAETVEIGLRNAYSSSTASLKNIQLQLLTVPDASDAQEIPTSAVGIVATNVDQLSSAVNEMERHYEHYAASAQKFASQWFAMHNPVRTVAHLIANNE